MRSLCRRQLFSALVLLAPAVARADVSGWANASAGPTFIDDGTETLTQGALSLQAGVGSEPSTAFVGGGLFHVETHFQRGTDIGLLARVATQGYVLGRWGAALDLGGITSASGASAPRAGSERWCSALRGASRCVEKPRSARTTRVHSASCSAWISRA